MEDRIMASDRGFARALRVTLLALLGAAPLGYGKPARATNLFNVYAGAAYVRAHLRAQGSPFVPFSGANPLAGLHRSDSGFQLTAGARGLELFGVEVDYFDLGGGPVSGVNLGESTAVGTHLSQTGEAAFALFYLPIPEPFIDVYVKAGVSRITSHLRGTLTAQDCTTGATCSGVSSVPFALNHTNTGFAAGAGVQWNVGSWGVRAEYDRLTALGAHPDLISIGVIRTFL
jgi:opacity protein-like surface antigen